MSQTTAEARHVTSLDVMRYRYHHGVNLGGVYVMEKWLFGSAFPPGSNDTQTSELEATKLWTKKQGMRETRKMYEHRWASAVESSDWKWLMETVHCTTIRLPIGYFTLGPAFCKDTPFELYSDVYINAWTSVKMFVSSAMRHGIGVLLDLHALPGGANDAEHSGTNSGKAKLWGKKKNLELARKCLAFVAKEIKTCQLLRGVIGLQICNEAQYNATGLYAWYDSVISDISSIDPELPLYISDGWDLGRAIDYVKQKNKFALGSSPQSNPIFIDTHKYFCFSDDDKSPQQIINSISDQFHELDGKSGSVVDSGAVQAIVGEWSCTLSSPTWSKIGPNASREQLTLEYGRAQNKRWQEKAGGSYFWTYKMDWMDGGDWGFFEQVNIGSVQAPNNLLMTASAVQGALDTASTQREARQEQSCLSHAQYWAKTAPGKQFEHWRFKVGWNVGWTDALSFFSMRSRGTITAVAAIVGDKIGCLELWVRKRIGDSGIAGSSVWEFETGLRKGISDFYECAGI